MKEVTYRSVGTAAGYEEYQNEYLVDGKVVATSSFDKNQKLHVCGGLGKNLYAASPEGMCFKISKRLSI